MIYYFAYAAIGKLLIYLFQKFLPAQYLFNRRESLKQLYECDLCLGVWIYFFLALIVGIDKFYDWTYIPAITEFIIGAITSFVIHLVSLGWKDKFTILYLE
ncbi:MAG: hypothetical protein ACW99Q_15735 [Candidatus Kariarchaeaceae archaeon]